MTYPNTIVLLGTNMIFVAAVLYIIALFLQEKVGAKETAGMCILTGSINAISAVYVGFVMGDAVTLTSYLLFGFTYFFFAFNVLQGADTNTGLGNYALVVAICAVPFFYVNFTAGLMILAFFWVMWGQLWAAFWVANGLQKQISKFLAYDTYLVAALNLIVGLGFLFGWITL